MTLFINQPMYMPAISQQAGIRVLLHRQGETPLVAEEGFNAFPGAKSAIAVRYVSTGNFLFCPPCTLFFHDL